MIANVFIKCTLTLLRVFKTVLTWTIVSSRSSTMRFDSVAKFPLIRASWSNSALVLMENEEREANIKNIKERRKRKRRERERHRRRHPGASRGNN